jgi:Leucine-rich repeat (LRR) protein
LVTTISCSSDDNGSSINDNEVIDEEQLSDKKQITHFQFKTEDNSSLANNIIAEIDEASKTITAQVSSETNISSLTPTITVSDQATITPASGIAQDFSNAVTYTVTAQDGSKQTYTVTIIKEDVSISDREILIEFFNANSGNTLGWDLEDQTMQSWDGVKVSTEGRVTVLNIHQKNISTLPSSFGGLTQLSSLLLSDNVIKSIPVEMGNLVNLYRISLKDNNLTTVPDEIGNLVNLKTLGLQNNNITSIPDEIGSLAKLEKLELKDNNLSSLPTGIGNLIKLRCNL